MYNKISRYAELFYSGCKDTIRGNVGLGNSGASMEIDANKDNYQQTAEKESMKKSANSLSAKRTNYLYPDNISGNGRNRRKHRLFTDGSGEPCLNKIQTQ